MKVLTINLNESLPKTKRVACIGFFECIHIGHQKLLKECFKYEGTKTFLTFAFQDDIQINKSLNQLLMTREQRIEIVKEYGFDEYIEILFNKETQNMPYYEFDKILHDWGIETLVCGYDFHYGKNRSGNITTLKNSMYFKVVVIDKLSINNQKISSSYIKSLIQAGEVDVAAKLLGRYYTIRSHVIKGKQLGRKIGFPTANLKKEFNYVYPKTGVYAGYVVVNEKKHEAMINVGYNPTVEILVEPIIEAHIFDFNEDIYDKKVEVEFVKHIRKEEKFDDLESLVSKIKEDEIKVRKYFNEITSI